MPGPAVPDPYVVLFERTVRRLAFWAAVILPFVLVVLVVSGMETRLETTLFTGLLALNGIAVVVGHEHEG